MTAKLGRKFRAILDGRSSQWTVELPITVRLKINATGTPTPNQAVFIFHNLPKQLRDDIVKDVWEDLEYRRISFMAGYDNDVNLPVIFVGNIMQAYSYRQGTDWLTEVECVDGGWGTAKGSINATFGVDATDQQIMRTVLLAMPNLTLGHISNRVKLAERTRGLTVCGNAWDEFVEKILPPDAQVFIRNEQVHLTRQDEFLPTDGGPTEISPDSGMIASPKRSQVQTIVTMEFEPRAQVGQKIAIKSEEPYSGDNKVYAVEHAGMISPTVNGELTTALTFIRSQKLVEV